MAPAADDDWLTDLQATLAVQGYALLECVLSSDFLEQCRAFMYIVQDRIRDEIGSQRLADAGEHGVLRLMMAYEPFFIRLLDLPSVVKIVDSVLSPTAIMHLQNGFILPPVAFSSGSSDFQYRFHQDFPRHLNGYVASLNILVAIDAFTRDNGATLVVPGTHQLAAEPARAVLENNAVPIECPPGSLVVFDSTLWHAAGHNRSGRDRLAINHQFTCSYIKQQIDYPRALGKQLITAQSRRTQQLLGWYTRVPSSLEEYYLPADDRFYRSKQG